MPGQDDDTVKVSVNLTRAVHRRLRIAVVEESRTAQDITEEAIREWLDRHGH